MPQVSASPSAPVLPPNLAVTFDRVITVGNYAGEAGNGYTAPLWRQQ